MGSQKSPIAKCAVVEQMVRRADHRCGDFSRVFPINDWSVYQPWISDEDFPYDYELHHRLLCKSPCKSPKNFHQFD